MQPKDLRVKGSSGGELHLLEWSSEGVPMLLLHGFGNEAHIWDDFAPIVAPHYRTVALDHRGHGQVAMGSRRALRHRLAGRRRRGR
jgi:pimeloyl-ACP methyl ester carboxylesterase